MFATSDYRAAIVFISEWVFKTLSVDDKRNIFVQLIKAFYNIDFQLIG